MAPASKGTLLNIPYYYYKSGMLIKEVSELTVMSGMFRPAALNIPYVIKTQNITYM